jgi:hypothetical protein
LRQVGFFFARLKAEVKLMGIGQFGVGRDQGRKALGLEEAHRILLGPDRQVRHAFGAGAALRIV